MWSPILIRPLFVLKEGKNSISQSVTQHSDRTWLGPYNNLFDMDPTCINKVKGVL